MAEIVTRRRGGWGNPQCVTVSKLVRIVGGIGADKGYIEESNTLKSRAAMEYDLEVSCSCRIWLVNFAYSPGQVYQPSLVLARKRV